MNPPGSLRPVPARSTRTGELRYRNDEESRRAIQEGRLPDPWPTG